MTLNTTTEKNVTNWRAAATAGRLRERHQADRHRHQEPGDRHRCRAAEAAGDRRGHQRPHHATDGADAEQEPKPAFAQPEVVDGEEHQHPGGGGQGDVDQGDADGEPAKQPVPPQQHQPFTDVVEHRRRGLQPLHLQWGADHRQQDGAEEERGGVAEEGDGGADGEEEGADGGARHFVEDGLGGDQRPVGRFQTSRAGRGEHRDRRLRSGVDEDLAQPEQEGGGVEHRQREVAGGDPHRQGPHHQAAGDLPEHHQPAAVDAVDHHPGHRPGQHHGQEGQRPRHGDGQRLPGDRNRRQRERRQRHAVTEVGERRRRPEAPVVGGEPLTLAHRGIVHGLGEGHRSGTDRASYLPEGWSPEMSATSPGTLTEGAGRSETSSPGKAC